MFFQLFCGVFEWFCVFLVVFMVFFKMGNDREVVFDFVSAWVSDRSNLGNLELDCMDASLDVVFPTFFF